MLLSNRVFDLVGERIDLAIRAGKLKDSSLITKRFFDLQINLWASPAYLNEVDELRHPKDLSKHRLLGLSSFKAMLLTNGKTEVQAPLTGRVVTDDFEVIKAMLILGEGIGWLPDFLAVDAVDAGTLAPVLPRWKANSLGGFSFVYPGKKYASPKVQAFIQTALEIIGKE